MHERTAARLSRAGNQGCDDGHQNRCEPVGLITEDIALARARCKVGDKYVAFRRQRAKLGERPHAIQQQQFRYLVTAKTLTLKFKTYV